MLVGFYILLMTLELVSKELNHFGVIADLFWQIGGHSSRFVLFCSFWRLFTTKMIKSVKVFQFSFWKIMIFFYFIKIKLPAKCYKMAAKWYNSLDTNSSADTYLVITVVYRDGDNICKPFAGAKVHISPQVIWHMHNLHTA